MSGYLKIWGILITRFLLKVFYIFSIKNDRIIFISYDGKDITCNPKYIYQGLIERYGNKYEYIWCLNKAAFYNSKYQVQKKVMPKTVMFFYYALTSKFYINNGIAPSYIPFRKNQCVIGTWHGGGAYKKGGVDAVHSAVAHLNYKLASQNVSYVLSSSRAFSEILQRSFLVDKDKILECGMPRNDFLFDTDLKKKAQIKLSLNIGLDKKILLYAPTFRSSFDSLEHSITKEVGELDTDKLIKCLRSQFGNEWIILYRSHYYVQNQPSDTTILDVSSYSDMQDLLYIADVLVTDYSSSIWDYALKKPLCPCFIFAEDIYQYERERGFETPIEKWPYAIAKTNEELQINILSFNYADYCQRVKQHLNDLGSFEQGIATDWVCNFIAENAQYKKVEYKI